MCTHGPNAIIFGVDHLHDMYIKICKGQAPEFTFISALL